MTYSIQFSRTESEYKKCLFSTHNSDCYRSSFVTFLSQEIRRQGFSVVAIKKWIETIISRVFFFPCYAIEDGESFQLLPLKANDGIARESTSNRNVVMVIEFHLSSIHLSSQVVHSLCESLMRTSHILSVNDTAEFFEHSDGSTQPLEFWSLSLADNDLGDECFPALLELFKRKEEKWCSWPKPSKENSTSTSESRTFSGVWLHLFDGNKFSAGAISALKLALRKKPQKNLCNSISTTTVSDSSTATALPTKAAPLEESQRKISSVLDSPFLRLRPAANDADVDTALTLNSHETSRTAAIEGCLLQNEANMMNDYRKRAFLLLSATPACEYINNIASLEPNTTSSVLASASGSSEVVPTSFSNAVPSPKSGRLACAVRNEKEVKVPFINTFLHGEHVPSPARYREGDTQDGRGDQLRSRLDDKECRLSRGPSLVSDKSMENKALTRDAERSESRFNLPPMISSSLRDASEDNLAHRYRSPWIEGGAVDLSHLTVDAPVCRRMTTQNEERGAKTKGGGGGLLSATSAERFRLLSEGYIQKKEDVDDTDSHFTSLDQKRDVRAEQDVEDTHKSIWDVLSFLQENQQLIGDRNTGTPLNSLLPSASAPSGLSVITVLDISHNHLSSIPVNALPPTLLRLDLSHNALSSLDGGAWLRSCRMLAVLNLRFNKLGYVEKHVLGGTPENVQMSAKKSFSSGNGSRNTGKCEPNEAGETVPSSSPLRGALESTPYLTHLFLGHNYLTSLDGIFGSCLLVLHTLDISYNRITSLSALRPLSLFRSLYQLILKDNPLQLPSSSTLTHTKCTSQSSHATPLSARRVPDHPLYHDATMSMSSSPGGNRSSPLHVAQLRPVLRNMLPQLTFVDDVNLRDNSSTSGKSKGKYSGTAVEKGGSNQNRSEVAGGSRKGVEYTRADSPDKVVKIADSLGRTERDDEKGKAGILMPDRVDARNMVHRQAAQDWSEPTCGANVKGESIRNINGLYSSPKHERLQHLALRRNSHPACENLNDFQLEPKSAHIDNLREYENSTKKKSSSSFTKPFNLVAQSPDKKSIETLVNERNQGRRSFTPRCHSSIQEDRKDNYLFEPSSLEHVKSLNKSNSEPRKGERAAHEQDKKGDENNDSLMQERQQGGAPVNPVTSTFSLSSFSEVWKKKLMEEQKKVQDILFCILNTLENQQEIFSKAFKSDSSTLQFVIALLKNNSKYRSQLLLQRKLTLEYFFFKEKDEISFSRETPKGRSLLAPTAVPKELDFILLGETTYCESNAVDSAAISEGSANSFNVVDLRAVLFACEDTKACLRFLVQLLKESTTLLHSLEASPSFSCGRIDSHQINRKKVFQKISEMEIQLFKNIKAIRRTLTSN